MFKFYHLLGFLWVLPVSILGWIFMGVMYVLRQVESVNVYPDLSFVWDLDNKGFFYGRISGKWFGFTLGNNIILIDVNDSDRNTRCYLHERQHIMQQYAWGIFFFPAYVIESLRLYFFRPEKHSYLDNRFERDAREYAGQAVNLPRSYWPDGPNDRWIWF